MEAVNEWEQSPERSSGPSTRCTFGEFIHAWRIRQGLKQTDVAGQAEINVANYNKIERDLNRRADGTLSILSRETVKKIARGLNVDERLVLNAAGFCDDQSMWTALAAAPYEELTALPLTEKTRELNDIREQIEHLVRRADCLLQCAHESGLAVELIHFKPR